MDDNPALAREAEVTQTFLTSMETYVGHTGADDTRKDRKRRKLGNLAFDLWNLGLGFYFPFHSGLRFSMNAAMPSFWSSVLNSI